MCLVSVLATVGHQEAGACSHSDTYDRDDKLAAGVPHIFVPLQAESSTLKLKLKENADAAVHVDSNPIACCVVMILA